MSLINWDIVKVPMNWFTVVLMVVIASFIFHFIFHHYQSE